MTDNRISVQINHLKATIEKNQTKTGQSFEDILKYIESTAPNVRVITLDGGEKTLFSPAVENVSEIVSYLTTNKVLPEDDTFTLVAYDLETGNVSPVMQSVTDGIEEELQAVPPYSVEEIGDILPYIGATVDSDLLGEMPLQMNLVSDGSNTAVVEKAAASDMENDAERLRALTQQTTTEAADADDANNDDNGFQSTMPDDTDESTSETVAPAVVNNTTEVEPPKVEEQAPEPTIDDIFGVSQSEPAPDAGTPADTDKVSQDDMVMLSMSYVNDPLWSTAVSMFQTQRKSSDLVVNKNDLPEDVKTRLTPKIVQAENDVHSVEHNTIIKIYQMLKDRESELSDSIDHEVGEKSREVYDQNVQAIKDEAVRDKDAESEQAETEYTKKRHDAFLQSEAAFNMQYDAQNRADFEKTVQIKYDVIDTRTNNRLEETRRAYDDYTENEINKRIENEVVKTDVSALVDDADKSIGDTIRSLVRDLNRTAKSYDTQLKTASDRIVALDTDLANAKKDNQELLATLESKAKRQAEIEIQKAQSELTTEKRRLEDDNASLNERLQREEADRRKAAEQAEELRRQLDNVRATVQAPAGGQPAYAQQPVFYGQPQPQQPVAPVQETTAQPTSKKSSVGKWLGGTAIVLAFAGMLGGGAYAVNNLQAQQRQSNQAITEMSERASSEQAKAASESKRAESLSSEQSSKKAADDDKKAESKKTEAAQQPSATQETTTNTDATVADPAQAPASTTAAQ